MSYPRHPKSARVDALLLAFAPVKQIVAETKAPSQLIHNRAHALGLRFVRITEEERRLIEARRKAA